MSIAAAVLSAASPCSSSIYSSHSNIRLTPAISPIAGTAVPPDVAQNPIAGFRPLVAICRLPPPASSAVPFFCLARASFVNPPAASFASAAYGEEENFGDEEWQNGSSASASGGGVDEEISLAGNNGKKSNRKNGSNEAGRLYVGNLPYTMTEAQLKEVFREAGPVRSAEVVYNRVTDRSRGFGFVTMAGADEAKEAVRLFDGSQLGGRTVKVNFPEVPRGGEREVMGPRMRGAGGGVGGGRFVESLHKVYAGNLGWSVTSESLRRALEGLPGFLGARVVYDRDTGRSRGYGFVSFASKENAQTAIDSMNGVELEGRPLRLSPTTQRAAPLRTSSTST